MRKAGSFHRGVRFREGLSWRLSFVMALSMLCILGILLLTLWYVARSFLLQQFELEGRFLVKTTALRLSPPGQERSVLKGEFLVPWVEELVRGLNARLRWVQIYDDQARPLLSTVVGGKAVRSVAERLHQKGTSIDSSDDPNVVVFSVAVPRSMHTATGVQKKNLALVELALSKEAIFKQLSKIAGSLFILGSLLILFAMLATSFTVNLLLLPVQELSTALGRAARGDFMMRPVTTSRTELGNLVQAFNRMAAATRERLESIRKSGRATVERARELSMAAAGLQKRRALSLEELGKLKEQTATLLLQTEEAQKSFSSAEPELRMSQAALTTLGSHLQEVRRQQESLRLGTDSTAALVEQLTGSIEGVALGVSRISSALDESSTNLTELFPLSQKLEAAWEESSGLNLKVERMIGQGLLAIQESARGLDGVHRTVERSARFVQALGARSQEIEEILNVVDDVAAQTHLLALNAAILAAQTGEQGKQFAGVVEEIRGLAERATASTKEIAGLLQSLRRESAEAGDALGEGLRILDDGSRRSSYTANAMESIAARTEEGRTLSRSMMATAQKGSQIAKKLFLEVETAKNGLRKVQTARQAQSETSVQLQGVATELRRSVEQLAERVGHQLGMREELGETLERIQTRLVRAIQSARNANVEALGLVSELEQLFDLSLDSIQLSRGVDSLRARFEDDAEALSRALGDMLKGARNGQSMDDSPMVAAGSAPRASTAEQGQ